MRQLTAIVSAIALLFSCSEVAAAADRDGFPGRRSGGGTRWSNNHRGKASPTVNGKVAAMAFASRTNLPISLRLRALYGG